MKKVFKILFIIETLLIWSTSFLAADDYDLPDVDDKYIGTYIPVDIEEEIKQSKDFYKSLNKFGYPNHHDVLFLGKNICYSDAHFHDGYAIKLTEFSNYKFETTSEDTFIYDEKGFKYRQISNFLNKNGYGYEEYTDYITKLIFENTDNLNNVKIKSGHIELDGIDYQINLDSGFFDTENVVFWLWSDSTNHCALVKNGLNGELHEGYRGEYRIWYPKEEVKAVYPLMFMNVNE